MDIKERNMWQLKRRGKGITQQEIADVLGYTDSAISKYERGHNGMDEDKLALYKKYIEDKVMEWEKEE